MRVIFLIISLLLQLPSELRSIEASSDISMTDPRIWIAIHGEWQKPGIDEPLLDDVQTASATLVQFRGDHEFSMIHCYVIKTPSYTVISPGDGQRIFMGTWRQGIGNQIEVQFRLVYESTVELLRTPDGLLVSPPDKHQCRSESAQIDDDTISFMSSEFYPFTSLEKSNYESFVAVFRPGGQQYVEREACGTNASTQREKQLEPEPPAGPV